MAKWKGKKVILFRWVVATLGLLLLTGLLWAGFKNFEKSQTFTRFQLWRAGVTNYDSAEGGSGLIQNMCKQTGDSEDAVRKGICGCVALVPDSGDSAISWEKILLTQESQWRTLGLNRPLKIFAIERRDPSSKRIRLEAEEIKRELQRICPSWIVVGQGLGGWTAQWLAMIWPEGVSRLLLVNSLGTTESLQRLHSQGQVPEDTLEDKLRPSRVPSILIWGQDDSVHPLISGYRLREYYPQGLWREVHHCGHRPQMECPEAILRSIVDLNQYGAM